MRSGTSMIYRRRGGVTGVSYPEGRVERTRNLGITSLESYTAFLAIRASTSSYWGIGSAICSSDDTYFVRNLNLRIRSDISEYRRITNPAPLERYRIVHFRAPSRTPLSARSRLTAQTTAAHSPPLIIQSCLCFLAWTERGMVGFFPSSTNDLSRTAGIQAACGPP